MIRKRRFKEGDRLIGNTGGDDFKALVVDARPWNPALKGCILVALDGGIVTHWMNESHFREDASEDASI